MSLVELLFDLQKANGHDLQLDERIAIELGYKRRVDSTSWYSPTGASLSRVPYFTASVDRAYEFAQILLPSNVAAVAWDETGATAVVNSGPQCYGANEAIAIIIAAIKAKLG